MFINLFFDIPAAESSGSDDGEVAVSGSDSDPDMEFGLFDDDEVTYAGNFILFMKKAVLYTVNMDVILFRLCI